MELKGLQFNLAENILPDSLAHYFTAKGIAHHFEEMVSSHSRAFIAK